MGRISKKNEAGASGSSIKGQTSLNSFFHKKPQGKQSNLFTQVLPAARPPPKQPLKPRTPLVHSDAADDGSDFRPRKKQRSPPAVDVHRKLQTSHIGLQDLDKAERKNPNKFVSREKPADMKTVNAHSHVHQSVETKESSKTHSSCDKLQVAGAIDCVDDDLLDFSLVPKPSPGSVQSVKPLVYDTPKVQATSFHSNTRRESMQESQGSPITVIPETPEAVMNADKSKRGIEHLTPTGNVEETFGTLTGIGHEPSTASSTKGAECTPKRGGTNGKGGVSRRGLAVGRIVARPDKLPASKLPGKIPESPNLLEEMLEEFAQSAQAEMNRKCQASRQKPPKELQGKTSHCSSEINSKEIVSVCGQEQGHSFDASPTKVPHSVHSSLGNLGRQEVDPIEDMLQEYAASSSSSLAKGAECKIPGQPLKDATLGNRRIVHAKRQSSKLSRTLRKKDPVSRSGLSSLVTSNLVNLMSDENLFNRSKLVSKGVASSSDELDLIDDHPEEDMLASIAEKKPTNPFAVRPSAIKLKASTLHKLGGSQSSHSQMKARRNMRKRSPCKGSSPYAKRPSTSHKADNFICDDMKDENLLVSYPDVIPESKEWSHAGAAAKKSLFQSGKENAPNQLAILGERSPTSPRNLTDKTNIYDTRTDSPPKLAETSSSTSKLQETSGDLKIGEIQSESKSIEGLESSTALGIDSLTSHNSPVKLSQGSDALWGNELNDSLLAGMDLDECLGSHVMSEEKATSVESEVVRDFKLLSPFKTSSQQRTEVSLPADLNRYKVTAIQNLGSEKVLQLYCLTEHKHKVCHLKATWLNTLVDEGDIVAVHGEFNSSGMCTVDQQTNFLVVHPDLLLTGTNISRSIRCMRRSVLSEKIKGMDSASKPMLLGTVLHDVFDKAVESRNFTETNLLKIVDTVSHQLRYLTDMYAIGMTEKNVLDEAQEYVGTMKQWADRYLQTTPKQSAALDIKMPNQHQSEKCNVCIPKVKDIEETVWSPRWGIKGKVDLTVQVKIHRSRGKESQMTVPLELKTGRQTNSIEHRSQLVLYSMMLGDIQEGPASDLGLLLYIKTGAMLAVPANHMDKRELVHLRNQLAYYISLPAKLASDGKWTLPWLPPPIEDDFTCGHCPHSVSCALLQRVDSENCATEQLSDAGRRFFADQISHLVPCHLEYFNHWYLLCALEGIAAEKKNQTKHMWSTDAHERELSSGGQCLSSLVISRCRHNKTEDLYYVSFQRLPGHSGKSLLDFQVSKGDRVAVSVAGTRQIAVCTGFIESISSADITLKSERPLQSGSKDVYRMDKDDAYNSMAASRVNLARLMLNNENAHRLRRLIVDLGEPQFTDKPQIPDSAKTKVANIMKCLNSDQQGAIDAVLRSQDYTLIMGMPGTGKTTTIVALVRILCACNLTVLLTSYTHSAVDNILLKLIKFGISPLRLGEAHRVHPTLGPYTTREALGGAKSVQQLASLSETKLVVATTCLGAKHALLTQRVFDVCIVDEASQISQMVCLGPLFHARRFVLVGDHKQLPPLVQSIVARQLGMDESLFQRLGSCHESTPSATVQLSLQYRMNSDIMTLSNALVYEGRLQCGNDAVAMATLNLPKWDSFRLGLLGSSDDYSWVLQALQPATTVSFLNTDQVRYPDSKDDKHTVNTTEALLVKHLVQCLMKCGCAAGNIGIISPYRNQCKLLVTMLDEHIEVNTVDKYQGRDKEVIIVSFVTKDQQSETGFLLKDIRRLNVALTRAKHKLILIGCVKALRKNGPMERLVDCLQTANLIATLPADACSKCTSDGQ